MTEDEMCPNCLTPWKCNGPHILLKKNGFGSVTPTLYRYRDSEAVIKHMAGYTPGEGWEPLYSQDEVDRLQAQLVRQQASYEAEIKVEIDAALERAAEICDRAEVFAWEQWKATGDPYNEGVSDGAASLARDIRALKESKE